MIEKPTLANWPTKRHEHNQMARYYAENDPIIACLVDYATMLCSDSLGLAPRLGTDGMAIVDVGPEQAKVLSSVARELIVIGSVVGAPPGVVLNPDWIERDEYGKYGDENFVMLPDDELKRIVWTKSPKKQYNAIPKATRQSILQGLPIPIPGAKFVNLGDGLVKQIAIDKHDNGGAWDDMRTVRKFVVEARRGVAEWYSAFPTSGKTLCWREELPARLLCKESLGILTITDDKNV